MTIFSQQAQALQFQMKMLIPLNTVLSCDLFSHVDQDLFVLILDQAVRFSDEKLSSLAEIGDRNGCQLVGGSVRLPPGTKEVYQQWCELGFPGLSLPLDVGGLGLPFVLQACVQEISDGANLGFGMLAINLRSAALALLEHANESFRDVWVPKLVSGEIAATIVISEPQAGSDVGRILTTATPLDGGSWAITGSKIWISYGDHDATEQILHMVLARVQNGQIGTRGLGLFAVPKLLACADGAASSNGVTVSRIEEKMGLHNSPTCALDFDDSRGYLIGEIGKGIQSLFVMMNSMRLSVAVQGSAVANAATLRAIEYASQRPQGGAPDQLPKMISEHQDVKRMLQEMTATSELIRALVLRTASYVDLSNSQNEVLAAQSLRRAELLLPVAKTISAESAFLIASQGVQVMGGYGYTNDYPIERMVRDVRVASLYEGTSGIQSLDFVFRKVIKDNGAVLFEFLDEIAIALTDKFSPFTDCFTRISDELREVVACLLAEDDMRIPEASAYSLLNLFALAIHCWHGHLLLTSETENSKHHERLQEALVYYASGLRGQALSLADRIKFGIFKSYS